MKKHLDEDEIANELRGGSLFFTHPNLVQPTETRPNVTISPSPQGAITPKRQGDKRTGHLVTNAPSHQGKPLLPVPEDPGAVLSEREYFRCTLAEVEAIEDLKTRLRRDLGIHTSKQDIERFAVQRAVEEYEERGEASDLVAVLRRSPKR